MKPNDGRATHWVSLNLAKDMPGNELTNVHNHMDYSSLERFRESVMRWLRDNSNLKTSTIKNANYDELYVWYKRFEKGE